ncbi:MAG: DNA polymerase III subunit delta [Dehalococcoidia bacterium]|nr:DNA polymerase III subunit delta [Dehalococcoidia bacterium]
MSTHVFYGDSFLVPRELKRLEAYIGVGELLDANRHSLRGNQLKPAELTSICNALPFMDDRRLVLVDGLLTTLERRTGRGWRRKGDGGKSSPPLGGWKELAQAVPVMPETTVLVFLDGPLSKGNPLLRLLSPLAQVQELLAPEKEALSRWIKESAQERGSSINPAAIRCLTDLVGNDLWTMDREIEKLTLYASGRAIEQSDVMELVSQVREANIFAAVDAMIDGRPGQALRLLHRLRQDGRDASNIFTMVERQLRNLALARDALDRRVATRDMGAQTGIFPPYALQKTLEQARRHSSRDIAARYRRLLEADLAVKQGRLEPDLAIELMVVGQGARTRA